MGNILTDKSKGKLKESAVQAAVHVLSALVGGGVGQAVGRPSFLLSVPIVAAGEYFEQPYVTSMGAGMASALTAPTSVNGMGNTDKPSEKPKLVNLKAAEMRLKDYGNRLKRATFLNGIEDENTSEGGSYSYYLSNSEVGTIEDRQAAFLERKAKWQAKNREKNMALQASFENYKRFSRAMPRKRFIQLTPQQQEALMSAIKPYLEGLGDTLADFDDYLDGHQDVNPQETFLNLRDDLNGILAEIEQNPELLDEIDDDALETMEGIIGMINGASMQGLNGHDEDFVKDLSAAVGGLEGIFGIDDDDDDEDLYGTDDEEEDKEAYTEIGSLYELEAESKTFDPYA